jgi:hypothetical protein
MQGEFDTQYPDAGISILGVNEAGLEAANEDMCEGRDIPWLQDTEAADWWGEWNVEWRDMIVVGADGEPTGQVVNLSSPGLGDADEYVAVKNMILDAAGA